MEGEFAKGRTPAASRMVLHGMWIVPTAFRLTVCDLARSASTGTRIDMEGDAVNGGGLRLENGWTLTGWGSIPPPSFV